MQETPATLTLRSLTLLVGAAANTQVERASSAALQIRQALRVLETPDQT